MQSSEITTWLKESGHDRHWLAKEIGCTYGTLTQWFSKGFPEWAMKSIERLINPLKDKGAGLELTFTDAEFDTILEAMKLTGYTTRRDFYHDAITEKAEAITSQSPPDSQTLRFPVKPEFTGLLNESPTEYGSAKAALKKGAK
jgi:hypothetical protein